MQISLKWINELVNIETIDFDSLIEKLTLGGFEVEEILEMEIENQKQIILDISATANRSDSLSIQGISKEMAALLNKSMNPSKYLIPEQTFKEKLLKNTLFFNEEECSFLCSMIVQNLTDIEVPKWIRQKLISAGITPFNNLLDFQNYILLETGHPFAFYDFDKIQAKIKDFKWNLSLSKAKKNEKFVAANGNQYELDDSILLIQANEIPISIAGIIESQEFAYSEKTTSLLIEGSIFNAAKIRQQSRKLGVRTDRSTRYEKSLTNTYLLESLYRLISLLRITNPNLKCQLQTIKKTKEETPKSILVRYETVGEILGPIQKSSSGHFEYLTSRMVEDYFTRLNFNFEYDPIQEVWEVHIPASRREDLTREIDLIEEVGRLHGFNNFLISLPKLERIGKQDTSYQTRQKMTSCLLNLGFNEFIHYSLVNETTYLKNPVQLVNPLVSDYSSLRVSLLPNLIQTIQENLKQGNSVINGFEYGHIFLPQFSGKFQEKEQVAGVFGGFQTKVSWLDSPKVFTWFEAKGKIEQLFNQLNLSIHWKNSSNPLMNDLLHHYRTAELFLSNDQKIGIFGQIHPVLANRLNVSSELYLFEFDLEVIQSKIENNSIPIYQEYSLYPKIIKDISFVISDNIRFEDIERTLYSNGTKFLTEIQLLDEYRGKSIPDDSSSLCLQLIFQSKERTLQNKEIEEIIDHIRFLLMKKFNATIRN